MATKPVGILLLVLSASACVHAQETFKPVKWVVRPSRGLNIPISTLPRGYISDDLFTYKSKSNYWQPISSAFYFGHWGIEFSLTGYVDDEKRHDRFNADVARKYSDNYFVNKIFFYDDGSLLGYKVDRIALGPSYKIEKKRWLYVARFLVGDVVFTADSCGTTLKGKGTNELVDVSWSAGSTQKHFFAFNPSFTLGYRITKQIVLDFDINYRQSKITVRYHEVTRDLDSGSTIRTEYLYHNVVKELSFGIGVMYVLK